jgi:hypothetical protein
LSRRLVAAVILLCACSARPAPPTADEAQPPFPDTGGRTVLLLPVQAVIPLIGMPAAADPDAPPAALGADMLAALEAELAYWLTERAPRTRWVLPDDVVRAAERSASLDVRPRQLPVRDFLRARLQSIGDPLYGDLRRLGVLTDSRLALLPVGAVWIAEQGGAGRVHMAAALIDTVGGAVLWYGVVAGTAGPRDDVAVAASAAESLARMVAR